MALFAREVHVDDGALQRTIEKLIRHSSSWFLLQRHPGGNAKASHGEATYSQVPRDGRRPSVHDLPCEASRSAKMGEGRSDRNLYAQVGAARRRNQGGDRRSAPTLGSKCRDLPGGEARGRGFVMTSCGLGLFMYYVFLRVGNIV